MHISRVMPPCPVGLRRYSGVLKDLIFFVWFYQWVHMKVKQIGLFSFKKVKIIVGSIQLFWLPYWTNTDLRSKLLDGSNSPLSAFHFPPFLTLLVRCAEPFLFWFLSWTHAAQTRLFTLIHFHIWCYVCKFVGFMLIQAWIRQMTKK